MILNGSGHGFVAAAAAALGVKTSMGACVRGDGLVCKVRVVGCVLCVCTVGCYCRRLAHHRCDHACCPHQRPEGPRTRQERRSSSTLQRPRLGPKVNDPQWFWEWLCCRAGNAAAANHQHPQDAERASSGSGSGYAVAVTVVVNLDVGGCTLVRACSWW